MAWPRGLTRLARHVRAVLWPGPGPALPSCSAWGEGAGGGRDVGGLACAAYGRRLESDHVRPVSHDHPQSPPSLSYRPRRDTSQKLRGKSTQGCRVSSGVLRKGTAPRAWPAASAWAIAAKAHGDRLRAWPTLLRGAGRKPSGQTSRVDWMIRGTAQGLHLGSSLPACARVARTALRLGFQALLPSCRARHDHDRG